MANNISGTPKRFSCNGLDYPLAADVDMSQIIGKNTNELIPTSGVPMKKAEVRIQTIEIVVIANGEETERLKRDSEDESDGLQLMIQDAAGDYYRTLGHINIDTKSSSENRLTINLLPMDPEGWTVTVA